MTVMAGLAAALVGRPHRADPQDVVYLGPSAEGSPLTKLLQRHSVGHDNWLSHWAKVSYDHVNTQVAGIIVEGSGPRTHRLLTFGHDPLLGLVVGTIDIMRGGMTAVDKFGALQVSGTFGPTEFNPFVALARQIAHILSDGIHGDGRACRRAGRSSTSPSSAPSAAATGPSPSSPGGCT